MELRRLVLLGTVLAVSFAGCGESGGSSGSPAAADSGCLMPAQVGEEESRIAEGVEPSQGDVEEKRDEIASVQSRKC